MSSRGWVALLWLGALVLLFTHLGGVPLRDWDEALVARVAEEISLRPFPANLLPTLWGEPYLNKPPLLHGLIAAAIQLWRGSAEPEALRQVPPEWLVRAVPALASSLIVPLVAMVQLRLRPADRLAVICTAAVALTLLPVMRHGRLAMLDGSLISAMTMQWWALLSLPQQPTSRQLRRFGLIAGLAGSAILLLKAPAGLPLLLGAGGLLALEQRRSLQQWWPLAAWIGMGLLPGLLWHSWHLWERGPDALRMWGDQGLARVVSAIEGHQGGLIVPVIEVLEGGWPWLALWPLAMLQAWWGRRQRWGYWVLGFTVLTAAVVLPLRTQLPWYSHLFWPSFALAVGPLVAQLIRREPLAPPWWARAVRWVPLLWVLAGALLLALQAALRLPATVGIPAGLGLVVGGTLLMADSQRLRRWGAGGLVLLLWAALLGLFASPIWLWELQESWAVAPVAAWVRQEWGRQKQPPNLLVLGDQRPSLDWMLGREVPAGRRARRQLRSARSNQLVLSFKDPSHDQRRCKVVQIAPRTSPQAPNLYRCNQA